jgi:hypothetical protein
MPDTAATFSRSTLSGAGTDFLQCDQKFRVRHYARTAPDEIGH